jgi:hypothetical protein
VNGFILAVIATLSSDVAPHFVAHFEARDACMKAAQVANANDPRLKAPEIAQFGARYVCLRAESDA